MFIVVLVRLFFNEFPFRKRDFRKKSIRIVKGVMDTCKVELGRQVKRGSIQFPATYDECFSLIAATRKRLFDRANNRATGVVLRFTGGNHDIGTVG